MAEPLSPTPSSAQKQRPQIMSPTSPFFLGSNDDKLERAQARAARAAAIRRKAVPASAAADPPPSDPCLGKHQILELFQNCIKLASENKINQKNTWELSLIDHLCEIIKVEEEDVETNFQKLMRKETRLFTKRTLEDKKDFATVVVAEKHRDEMQQFVQTAFCSSSSVSSAFCAKGLSDSEPFVEEAMGLWVPLELVSIGQSAAARLMASCTLEAGVKIYSMRVDSVHSEAYKVLGGINRVGQENEQDSMVEDANINSEQEEGCSKKEQGKKLSPLATLESSFESLNVKKFDVAFAVDPLYHQTSAQFDEGGAKGLLLNNLGVYGGCRVLFDSLEVPGKCMSCASQKDKAETIDISFARECIEEMVVSVPKKDEISPSLRYIVHQFDEENQRSSATFSTRQQAEEVYEPANNNAELDNDAFENCGAWDFDHDDPTSVVDEGIHGGDPNLPSHHEESEPFTFDDDDDGDNSSAEVDGFLFLTLGFTSKQNSWAGPDHWKYRKAKGSVDSTKENGSPLTIKKAKNKKAEVEIDFTKALDNDSSDIFAPPKNPKSLLLPAKRELSNTTLPEDCHYQPEDLVKLFLLPNVMCLGRRGRRPSGFVVSLFIELKEIAMIEASCLVKAVWELSFGIAILPGSMLILKVKGFFLGGCLGMLARRITLGLRLPCTCGRQLCLARKHRKEIPRLIKTRLQWSLASVSDELSQKADDYGPLPSWDDASGVGDAFDDGYAYSDVEDSSTLVSQPRQVNKIDVQYDKTSKQVDVHVLKEVLWNCMQESQQMPAEGQEETISLRHVLATFPNDCRAAASLDDISPHLCFICLLHLANEHGLSIRGCANLDDLKIHFPPHNNVILQGSAVI
ncbi:hypothetical protein RJ639_014203 [Escallonia herrerae]|uniref:Condensin complex subunit 2 n=1 Tax=Escallonia herrerae TaxID=1293975 RepID=A0AA88VLN4_9ASTE|nr:hypothetical protein RJ639_014203 [Escallonia herrerae]